MGQKYADVCKGCGKTVVKNREGDSSDMVKVKVLELLYLSDEYLPGKLSRPSLNLIGDLYCPDCLIKALSEWVSKIKKLKPSVVTVVKAV